MHVYVYVCRGGGYGWEGRGTNFSLLCSGTLRMRWCSANTVMVILKNCLGGKLKSFVIFCFFSVYAG